MGVKERKEREKEMRRKTILEASERLFMERGVKNVSIEQIANEIEMSRGAIYLYFKNKEEIFLNIIIKALETLEKMLKESVVEGDSPVDKLVKLGAAYMNFYRSHRNYFMLTNFMLDSDHKEIEELCMTHSDAALEVYRLDRDLWDIIINVYEEGMREGVFRSDLDPTDVALLLWSSSNGIIRFIDHVEQSHKIKPDFLCREEDDRIIKLLYGNMSIDRLMRLHWDMSLNYIKNPTSDMVERTSKTTENKTRQRTKK